jgi:hypothetical protein
MKRYTKHLRISVLKRWLFRCLFLTESVPLQVTSSRRRPLVHIFSLSPVFDGVVSFPISVLRKSNVVLKYLVFSFPPCDLIPTTYPHQTPELISCIVLLSSQFCMFIPHINPHLHFAISLHSRLPQEGQGFAHCHPAVFSCSTSPYPLTLPRDLRSCVPVIAVVIWVIGFCLSMDTTLIVVVVF